jgi:hypothetical protein
MPTFFRIDTLAVRLDDYDPTLACVGGYPLGMGLKTFKLSQGFALDPGDYPKHAQVPLHKDNHGEVLTDLLANTRNMLIVSTRVKEAFEHVNKGPTEYYPVGILNHSGKEISRDYFIVNPIGTYDILDTKASKINYYKKDVVSIDTYVIDPKKALHVPDLFRIKEKPDTYVMSEKMRDYIREKLIPKPTNFFFFRMEPVKK